MLGIVGTFARCVDCCTVGGLLLCCTAAPAGDAATLLLKDGRTLEGALRRNLPAWRRTRFRRRRRPAKWPLTPLSGDRRRPAPHVHPQQPGPPGAGAEHRRDVRIKIWQQVAERGGGVGRIGRAARVTPFDEFGRRIYEMQSTEGPAVDRAGHHADHAAVHEGRRPDGRPAADRLGHADRHQQHPARNAQPHPHHGRAAGRSGRPAASRAAVSAKRALSRRRHGAGADHQGLSRAQGSAARQSANCGNSARG